MVIAISQAEKGAKPFGLYKPWLEDPEFLEMFLQKKFNEVKSRPSNGKLPRGTPAKKSFWKR